VPNRPPRAPGFTYVGEHRYFLTICTDRRRRLFENNGAASWLVSQIVKLFESERFAVIAFCVMPDHVHMLLEGLRADADLRSAVHVWKLRTGFAWKQREGQRLWQSGFYDYVLRDEDSVASIVKYIIGNPVRARLVGDASQYPYSGSPHYDFAQLADVALDWRPRNRRRV
jgi:REP element-mobilizing transposase RayT